MPLHNPFEDASTWHFPGNSFLFVSSHSNETAVAVEQQQTAEVYFGLLICWSVLLVFDPNARLTTVADPIVMFVLWSYHHGPMAVPVPKKDAFQRIPMVFSSRLKWQDTSSPNRKIWKCQNGTIMPSPNSPIRNGLDPFDFWHALG